MRRFFFTFLTVIVGATALGTWLMYAYVTKNIHDALLAIWLTQLFTCGTIITSLERQDKVSE